MVRKLLTTHLQSILDGFHLNGIPIFFRGRVSLKAKERVLKIMEIQETTSMDLEQAAKGSSKEGFKGSNGPGDQLPLVI